MDLMQTIEVIESKMNIVANQKETKRFILNNFGQCTNFMDYTLQQTLITNGILKLFKSLDLKYVIECKLYMLFWKHYRLRILIGVRQLD
jgi:hypothetical protein